MKTFIILGILILLFFFPLESEAKKFFYQDFEERYDPNTEIFIEGKVKSTRVVSKKKILILELERGPKTYKIILGPLWFINERGIILKPDEKIFVEGSKFVSEDGEVFIMPKSLYRLEKNMFYQFRDKEFKPYWKKKKSKGF